MQASVDLSCVYRGVAQGVGDRLHEEVRLRRNVVGAVQPQDLVSPLCLSEERLVQCTPITLAIFDECLRGLQEDYIHLALGLELLCPGLRFQGLLHGLQDGLGLLLSGVPCCSSLLLTNQLRCSSLTKPGTARSRVWAVLEHAGRPTRKHLPNAEAPPGNS
ncbi:hypothetical protein [Streptomyces sp. NPDC005784]|uniref:hypothetical protein n=1 Tax=Streptomyces sp. NPDC005784 TaxID=3364731 RepID=UPI0036B6B368